MTGEEKYNAMKNMLNDGELLKILERIIEANKEDFTIEESKEIMGNKQLYIDKLISTMSLDDINNNIGKLGAVTIFLIAMKLNPTGGRRRRRKSLRKRRKSKKRRKKTKKRRRRRRR